MILKEFGIELAPESDPMTYNDAKMYCFTLTHDNKIGWRMPVYEEWCCIPELEHDGWYEKSVLSTCVDKRRVRPVRDIR